MGSARFLGLTLALSFGSAALAGAAAPDFGINGPGGRTTLSGLTSKGEVVLLDFSAGDRCPACGDLAANLQQSGLLEKKGLTVAVVYIKSSNLNEQQAGEHARKHGVKYSTLDATNSLMKTYGVRLVPTMFLIDKSGNQVWTGVGSDQLDTAEFKSALQTAMAGKSKREALFEGMDSIAAQLGR